MATQQQVEHYTSMAAQIAERPAVMSLAYKLRFAVLRVRNADVADCCDLITGGSAKSPTLKAELKAAEVALEALIDEVARVSA